MAPALSCAPRRGRSRDDGTGSSLCVVAVALLLASVAASTTVSHPSLRTLRDAQLVALFALVLAAGAGLVARSIGLRLIGVALELVALAWMYGLRHAHHP